MEMIAITYVALHLCLLVIEDKKSSSIFLYTNKNLFIFERCFFIVFHLYTHISFIFSVLVDVCCQSNQIQTEMQYFSFVLDEKCPESIVYHSAMKLCSTEIKSKMKS